jgi:ABC-type transport system involved in multi-copper enzyme maturation permease subunit
MNWVTWQQHKKQFLIVGLLLTAFAALAIPTGLHFWHTYQSGLAACTATSTCDQLSDQLFASGFESRMLMVMKATVVIAPFMLAIFWGVPLVAREYIEHTHLLAWTQSVSRRKWLTAKLVWVLAATAVVAGVIAVLSTWWWRAGNALYLDRFHSLNFGIQGIVPVAAALFAVAVGIAFGAWLKRILPAIALALGLLIAVQIVLPTMVRPHYAKPAVQINAMQPDSKFSSDTGPDQPPKQAGASWVISADLYNKKGELLNWSSPPAKCSYTQQQMEALRNKPEKDRESGGYVGREGGKIISLSCLAKEGYKWHVSYQPADRYWKFQFIEAAIYVGLAMVPLAATYWLVLKRDA